MRHATGLALGFALALFVPVASSLAAPCPRGTGDLAPGQLIAGAPVPRWSPTGDGRFDVGDVVAVLREAVGLQVTDGPAVGGDCASLPGDLAPGMLDDSTLPPTWRPRGDGVVDIADAVVGLRASVGLVQLGQLAPRQAHQLKEVASCEDLGRWVKDAALASFEATGGWGGGWWWMRWGGGPLEDATTGVPTAGAGDRAGSYSSTNVQIAGVDEPDIVKTDGTLVLALSGQVLRVVRAWPADDMTLLASVPIEGWPSGLFLDRSHAVVISQLWAESPVFGPALTGFWSGTGMTKLTVIDLRDPAQPRVVREIVVEGWLQASRLVSGRTVLVMYHSLQGPPMPEWTGDDTTWREAVRRAIAGSTLEDWLPEMADVRHALDGTTTVQRRFAMDCDGVHRPDDLPPAGFVNVLELDAVVPGPLGSAAIVGTASTVHVSQRRVVVAMDHWTGAVVGPDSQRTRLQVFALGGAQDEPRYLGAGEVPGWVGTPWAMDFDGDDLRVATMVRDETWRPSTNVHVLQPNGTGDLAITGSITGLAPGETLMASRFMGARGYLVTFERVDPLFVLDLADATAPRVAGELEISGWSSYLHPLAGEHLIGIGREVDPDTQMQLGMHVSVFDVGDPARPSLVARHLEPIGSSGSEAEWDHHAFTYFEPLETLAVPIVAWEPWRCGDCEAEPTWRYSNRLQLYRVTPSAIQDIGAMDLTGLAASDGCPGGCGWCAQVRRSVFLEDFVLAVTDAGLAAARASAPANILSTVKYPDWLGCGGGVVVPGGDPGMGGEPGDPGSGGEPGDPGTGGDGTDPGDGGTR